MGAAAAAALREARRAARRWAPWLGVVTPLGWLVLGGSVVCWLLAAAFGWLELLVVGATGLLVFALCTGWAVGRTALEVRFGLDRERVVAGQSTGCGVEVAGRRSGGRLLALELELPIGPDIRVVDVPGLAAGQVHREWFEIPTTRRGVIPVGPAVTVRGDPLGVVRRALSWDRRRDLHVHPVTTPLSSLGAGLLRDLEGHTTNDPSNSDLAFHTLREYAPGDDRRHIHWRSSAKVSGAARNDTFLVRQYLDTRRARLVVVVDGHPAAYAEPDDFEVAMSVAGSLCLRAVEDEIDLSLLAAGQVVHDATAQRALDGLAMATPAELPLAELTARAARIAPDATMVALVTGAHRDFAELDRAAAQFTQDTSKTAFAVAAGRPAGLTGSASLTIAAVRDLTDLRAVVEGGTFG
ncbi:hypothetical protein BJP25_01910 [Actinokineospora bangkokensis]|uniref:Uncharacterized protein n=1 Tax=Actinokineospora bangkokensis TaxID=1193682 RepID=A0A1Q9LCQ7_9PSEU|nr:hypothetical protein BJP25_01910 [Actinokineospora bangkokensis]